MSGDRIEALEATVAHLLRAIDDMSDEIARRNAELDRLTRHVALLMAREAARGKAGAGRAPMVVLSTAHPAKFPAAVEQASGTRPALPAWLGDLMEREERYSVLPSDRKMVEDHISRLTRAAS